MAFHMFSRFGLPHRTSKKGRAARKPSPRLPLRLETLEDRLLMSFTPQLLQDINTQGAGSNPASITEVNGRAFFAASDGVHAHGTELWVSDGTQAGTHMVLDINPGQRSSYPFELTNVNGTVFFSAVDGVHGRNLWESNGTAAGTFMVQNLGPSNYGSYPYNLTNVNGTLFFQAGMQPNVNGNHTFTSGTGAELWESNGTAAGTFMVQDINPGPHGSYPRQLTNVNGSLFFEATDGTHGYQLWGSNGTSASTQLVADINPSSPGSYPYSLTNVNGTLFFQATDGTHGGQLWQSNGTAVGTQLVTDINPGGGFNPYRLTNVNGTLFFSANDGTHGFELWQSNGAAAGTQIVADINPGSNNSYPRDLTNVNGTLFFTADDGTNGRQLWESNGAVGGTFLVQNINPHEFGFPSGSDPRYLTNVNGTLFLQANDGTHGYQLWESNGAGETALVGISARGSLRPYLTNVNGTLFFAASDGTHGGELWTSNGTVAGTTMVAQISQDTLGSYPYGFTNVNGTVFFVANDGVHGNELWDSNGATGGTALVADINPGPYSSNPTYLTNVNGTLFFSADDGVHGRELWESNGSAAGTQLVTDINFGLANSNPRFLTNVNGTLFFSATDGSFFGHGDELWESNGTAAGTQMVADIKPGGSGSYPRYLTNVNGTLFFAADDGTSGNQLWESNGAAAGTQMVADINPHEQGFPNGSNPLSLTNVNGTLFFAANDGAHGRQLWESNGAAAGTQMVADIGPAGSNPTYLTNVGGTLFFSANDGVDGSQLWESNGTAAGTQMLTAGNNIAGGFQPEWLTNVNGTLFFSANDGVIGRELWDSNGTNVIRLADINPGNGSSNPGYLTNVNGTLFFSANDGVHGRQLWQSDGTVVDTTMVQDINPGRGAYPYALTNINGTLFFSADDGTHGAEPWTAYFKGSTSTAVSSTPGSAVFGQPVQFTAAVTSSTGTPTGTVDFMEGTTDLTPGGVSLARGIATFTTAFLSLGSHTVTAVYSGSGFFDGSTGNNAAAPELVTQAPTQTTISASLPQSVRFQPVTFTATVAPVYTGTPTGTVAFLDAGQLLADNVTLDSHGRATFSTANLALGINSISVTYSGSSDFFPSQGVEPIPRMVFPNPTSTVVKASANPGRYGQVITLTASVRPRVPVQTTPRGSVQFFDGSTFLGIATLVSGLATFSTSSLASGNHALTASYGGSADFTSSTSIAYGEPIAKDTTTTALVASVNPTVFGQIVTYTATVATPAGAPTSPAGVVIFQDGSTTIGAATLNSASQATFATRALAVASHTITATYRGNGNFAASHSTSLDQVVHADATLTTIQSSLNPSVLGHTVTFTAKVFAKSPGAGSPTGTVTFKDGSTVLGTGTLSAGQATFSTSTLRVGNHAITATYGGNASFASSTSNPFGETVHSSSTNAIGVPTNAGAGTSAAATTTQSAPHATMPLSSLAATSLDTYFASTAKADRSVRSAGSKMKSSDEDWLGGVS
jgi:ELWxxDGT repeat protein